MQRSAGKNHRARSIRDENSAQYCVEADGFVSLPASRSGSPTIEQLAADLSSLDVNDPCRALTDLTDSRLLKCTARTTLSTANDDDEEHVAKPDDELQSRATTKHQLIPYSHASSSVAKFVSSENDSLLTTKTSAGKIDDSSAAESAPVDGGTMPTHNPTARFLPFTASSIDAAGTGATSEATTRTLRAAGSPPTNVSDSLTAKQIRCCSASCASRARKSRATTSCMTTWSTQRKVSLCFSGFSVLREYTLRTSED